MIKYTISNKSNKAFLKWSAKGNEEYRNAVSYALETLLPMTEEAGFKWVEKTPDGFKIPSFYIDMSRSTKSGYERVSFNFNKYRKLKFAIAFTISDPSADYVRNVIGGLAPRNKEDHVQHWWGVSLFDLNKQKTFKKDVDKVAKILPQVIGFLTDGTVGENIWISRS